MNLLRCFFLLQFATALALAQPALQGNSADPPDEPAEMVRSLYREVVARHPVVSGNTDAITDWILRGCKEK
jgi:hypothetical protein